MFPTIKTTLLGAALAAATPIAHNTALAQQNTVSLATLLPNGTAPVFMAQVADPPTEAMKCNLDLFLACVGTGGNGCGPLLNASGTCTFRDLFEHVVDSVPPYVNISAPILINGPSIVIDEVLEERPAPGPNNTGLINDIRNASAPAALEQRQANLCPKACAAWAAIPPFGLWFGVCVGDCNLRCKQGGHCP